jgi:pimeloyl-ACP methyl ester carboxylesterase
LTCPTLIVVGEKDGALKRSQELHKRISQSEFAVIPEAGHPCCLENPWEFDRVVVGFLRRHGLLPSLVAPSGEDSPRGGS